jgi:porphobilinogen deaminase
LQGDAGVLAAAAALRDGEAAELAELDAELAVAGGEQGVVATAARTQSKQLRAIEGALKKDRDVVARFRAMGLSS